MRSAALGPRQIPHVPAVSTVKLPSCSFLRRTTPRSRREQTARNSATCCGMRAKSGLRSEAKRANGRYIPSGNDISVHFKEFVVRDGRWGAKFSLKNNTRDHVVTHIDYRGEYKKDGKKKTFTRKREGKLKLNKPLLPGKSFTLTVLLSAPATPILRISLLPLLITGYRIKPKKVPLRETISANNSLQQCRIIWEANMSGVVQVLQASIAAAWCSMSARNMALPSPAPAQNRPKVEYLLPKNMFAPEIWYFSGRKSSGPVDHVGIYIGNDIYVHAPNPDYTVMKTRLSDNSFTKVGTPLGFSGEICDGTAGDSLTPYSFYSKPAHVAQSICLTLFLLSLPFFSSLSALFCLRVC